MAAQKQDDQHERTFSSYVRIQVVVLKTCLGRWTIGRSVERGSGISVLPARYDDDDDDDMTFWLVHSVIPIKCNMNLHWEGFVFWKLKQSTHYGFCYFKKKKKTDFYEKKKKKKIREQLNKKFFLNKKNCMIPLLLYTTEEKRPKQRVSSFMKGAHSWRVKNVLIKTLCEQTKKKKNMKQFNCSNNSQTLMLQNYKPGEHPVSISL